VPATITVLNANDSGADSLRSAIEQANLEPGQDTIDFAPAVTGTITLLSPLPDLSTDIILSGPGASALTVARSTAPGTPNFRILTVTSGVEVTISGLTITGGRDDSTGGGGIDNSGTLTVTNSTVSGNSAIQASLGGAGAGIFNSGTLTVANSTVSGNGGGLGGSIGGGIYNSSMLTVTNSTFSDNSAGGADSSGRGGGIYNSGTLTVTNSTFTGNSARSAGPEGRGGGIDNSGTLTVTSSTFSGNAASGVFSSGAGGGIDNSGTLTVTTSLFADADGSNLISAGTGTRFVSGGHNLFSDVPAVPLDATDLINSDPMLGALADNGGPTFTQALLPGSPALDAGVPVAGLTTDQRGVPRPQGRAPDIGAFESRGFTLAVVSGDDQRAAVRSTFLEPLTVRVTSPFGEPVAGGRVTFAAPTTGATAVLSTNPAILDANGQAAVTATANGVGGSYAVTARTAGASDVALTLTNLVPPAVTGVVSVTHSKKGITQIILGFSEDLIPGSATNSQFFGIASDVKRRHKVVFSKRVKIAGVTYDGTADRVTIQLAKPLKGRLQVTVHGGIMATDGVSSQGDFTVIVNSSGLRSGG
jgi:hypothetical protein